MPKHPEKKEGYTASADCIMDGCENTSHDVWFHYNDAHEVIATTLICRLCGTKDTWGDPEEPEDTGLMFKIHPDRIIKR